MDRAILRAVRWMWQNRIVTSIVSMVVLYWISADLFRQFCRFIFETMAATATGLLSILVEEASRYSASIGSLILIVIVCWAIWHIISAPFRGRRGRH